MPNIDDDKPQNVEIQKELLIAKMAKWARMNNKK